MKEMKLRKTLPQQLADVGAREQFPVKAPKEIPSLSCAEARETGEALAHCLARPSQQGEGTRWVALSMARDREAKAEWKIPQGKVRGPRSWTRNELLVPKVDPGTPFRVQWTVLFSHRLTCRKEANPHFPKGSLGLQLCCVSRHSLSCRFPYPPVLNGVWLSSGKAVGRETEAKAPLVSLGYWGVLSVTNYYKAQFRKEKKNPLKTILRKP